MHGLLLWLLLLLAPARGVHYVQQTMTIIYQEARPGPSLIDEQLYSRQLYVYGRHAQQRLQEGHVIVYCGEEGSEPALAAECIKNLALAGVGRISVFQPGAAKKSALQGSAPSLAAYAHELNPLVVAQTVPSLAALHGLLAAEGQGAVLVAADTPLAAMCTLDARCREAGCCFVGCRVQGVCGMLVDDFGEDFLVTDIEGEAEADREVPLRSAVEGGGAAVGDSSGEWTVTLTCIEEEVLSSLGLGDNAEVGLDLPALLPDAAQLEELFDAPLAELLSPLAGLGARMSKIMPIVAVVNTRTVTLRADSSEDAHLVCLAVQRGLPVTLKKTKRAVRLSHRSVEAQLVRPDFTPANACLPQKRDTALSTALLAAFKVSPPPPHTHKP